MKPPEWKMRGQCCTCAWGNMFPRCVMRTHPALTCSCKHTPAKHESSVVGGARRDYDLIRWFLHIATTPPALAAFCLPAWSCFSLLFSPLSFVCFLSCYFHCPVFVRASLSSNTGKGCVQAEANEWRGFLITWWAGEGKCLCIGGNCSWSWHCEKQDIEAWEHYLEISWDCLLAKHVRFRKIVHTVHRQCYMQVMSNHSYSHIPEIHAGSNPYEFAYWLISGNLE